MTRIRPPLICMEVKKDRMTVRRLFTIAHLDCFRNRGVITGFKCFPEEERGQ